MPSATRTAFADEEARIREAYARRRDGRRYSWLSPAYAVMMQDRERRALAVLARHGLDSLRDVRILDIGCGTGQWLRHFVTWGARPSNLVGVDLLPDRIAEARETCPAAVTLLCSDAVALDFADASFDIVVQSTVFTSILDREMRRAVAAEMLRVVRPSGLILWYDYFLNNRANRDVRGVRKREIRELFPGCRIDLARATLAPPIARAVAPYSRAACWMLGSIPLLRTHYLGAIRKRRP